MKSAYRSYIIKNIRNHYVENIVVETDIFCASLSGNLQNH